MRPVFHAAEAEALFFSGCFWVKADAVVRDCDVAEVWRNLDYDLIGLSVADGVGESFLNDAVKLVLDGRFKVEFARRDVEGDFVVVRLDEILEGRGEAPFELTDGIEPAGEPLRLIDGSIEELANFTGFGCFRTGFVFQGEMEGVGSESGSGEELPHTIVNIEGDAHPFLLGAFQKVLFEEALTGDVTENEDASGLSVEVNAAAFGDGSDDFGMRGAVERPDAVAFLKLSWEVAGFGE